MIHFCVECRCIHHLFYNFCYFLFSPKFGARKLWQLLHFCVVCIPFLQTERLIRATWQKLRSRLLCVDDVEHLTRRVQQRGSTIEYSSCIQYTATRSSSPSNPNPTYLRLLCYIYLCIDWCYCHSSVVTNENYRATRLLRCPYNKR